MKEHTKAQLELFVANTLSVKKGFVWQDMLLKRLSAFLYTAKHRAIDCEAIRDSYNRIKAGTRLFSTFRGNSAMTIATMLSLCDNQDVRLANTLAVYEMMKKEHFWSSDYLVVAAYQIAANTKPAEYEHAVTRTKAFYYGIRREHPILTGQDGYIFAAMLGLSDVDIESGIARIEQHYDILKPMFSSGKGVQALTQVLVLGGDTTGLDTRVLALHDAFRDQKIRLDREYVLSSLGVLSLLPVGIDTIVNDVTQAYKYLRTQRGFGRWTIAKQELLLLAASLIALEYVDDVQSGVLTTTISTSITNILIAQQTAIVVAAAASAAAASSASH